MVARVIFGPVKTGRPLMDECCITAPANNDINGRNGDPDSTGGFW